MSKPTNYGAEMPSSRDATANQQYRADARVVLRIEAAEALLHALDVDEASTDTTGTVSTYSSSDIVWQSKTFLAPAPLNQQLYPRIVAAFKIATVLHQEIAGLTNADYSGYNMTNSFRDPAIVDGVIASVLPRIWISGADEGRIIGFDMDKLSSIDNAHFKYKEKLPLDDLDINALRASASVIVESYYNGHPSWGISES